jgi:enterochelin esterase-like enzyme
MLHFQSAGLKSIAGLMLISLALGMPLAAAEPTSSNEVLQGEVTKYSFEKSKVFPGTIRDYWVYVPRQYNPDKPACLHVNQDGIQFNAPAVFDQLIGAGEMPVTIGVFITPGRVKAASDQALDRFNRSYEYDGLGDGYARFVLDELLPEVERKTTADGRTIRLSHDGNDRSIGGSSSGAICAFTAAWERPDAFRRVFSAIGTYVGLRGGNDYPTLIRKFEPKPLRVFLQDGSGDLNIYGGDWWMANQEMERAFVFAGYEVNHSWGDGGHNGKHATQVFPDAMRWLWKDWPAPVKAGAGSPPLQAVLKPNEPWKLVADGFKSTEGPAVNARGEIFFNDVPNEQGNSTVVADGFRGNDLVVRYDGGIYVTNPGWDGKELSKVWYVNPQGEKKVVDTGLKFSNGITLSPDQSLLYVADSRTHWVYSYQVRPDGTLANKQRYFHLHMPDTADESGADGLRVDRDGRLYVATKMGIQVCDQAGRVNCIIPTPNGKVSNFSFGGENFETLYATCSDRIYARKLNVRGAPSFQAPLKPAAPKL